MNEKVIQVLLKRIEDLEKENQALKGLTKDLKFSILKLAEHATDIIEYVGSKYPEEVKDLQRTQYLKELVASLRAE